MQEKSSQSEREYITPEGSTHASRRKENQIILRPLAWRVWHRVRIGIKKRDKEA